MTRKEQIEEISKQGIIEDFFRDKYSFIKGAEWADDNQPGLCMTCEMHVVHTKALEVQLAVAVEGMKKTIARIKGLTVDGDIPIIEALLEIERLNK